MSLKDLILLGLRTVVAVMIVLITVVGCDNNDVTVGPENNPPEKPSAPFPADNAVQQDLYIKLTWEITDPENDMMTYDLYFGTTNPPSLLGSGLADYSYPLYRSVEGGKLDFETTYYWKVIAVDINSNETEGDVWNFTTSNLYLVSANIENTYNKSTFDTENANKVFVKDITSDSAHFYIADDYIGLIAVTLKDSMVIKNRVDTLVLKTGVELGSFSIPEYVYDVDIEGDLAFVTSRSAIGNYSLMTILDISDPSDSLFLSPSAELGYYNSSGVTFYAVDVSGTDAFVASGDGLVAIDVTDPANPALLGSVSTPGTARDVFVSGNYAYVADTDSGLQIIDITDTSSPEIVGNYNYSASDSAWGVFVSGNTAYVAYGSAGLVVVDVTNATEPVSLGSYDTPGFAKDVYVDDTYAYVADYFSGGLQIIDITSPASPVYAANYETPGGASGVFANANYIFLADRWNGLMVFEFQP